MKEGATHINTFKKMANAILNVILFIEICLVALFLLPNLFGIKTYVVTSGSMEPMYPTGSLIYVQKVDPKEVKENDTITFYMEGGTIVATHQVYEVNQDKQEFRTQGINNRDEEGNIIHDATPVAFSSLIGKPIVCIPKLGYLNRLVTTLPGLYWAIAFTIFFILIYLILNNMEVEYEKKNSKKRKQ